MPSPPRREFFWRRKSNRRVQVQRRAAAVVLADGLAFVCRKLLRGGRVAGKAVAVLAFVAAVAWGGRLAVSHVLASPRFALRDIEVTPTVHVKHGELLALAGVRKGDKLLSLDTDEIAGRLASHPWVAKARVSRRLPSALKIEITEHNAAAVVTLGGLYLIDETGRPFKRASMQEADGLPVITGMERAQYVDLREAIEAVFREALAILASYGASPGRPPLSEVNIDPPAGFTLYLLTGGGEIRLGRGDYGKKLAQLDRILEAVKNDGNRSDMIRVVHLDGTGGNRVPVRLERAGATSTTSSLGS